jgi:D-3-phosphoglycerate dehydrogenase
MQVLITDRAWADSDIEREILADIGAEVVEAPDAEESTLIELAAACAAIATCWAPVTARVIDAAVDCRLIARMGIGLDNIDVDAATRRKIPVTNVPDYCVEEVSDHALALLLALARNIGFFHLAAKQGRYDLQAAGPMRRLAGQTLGLLGLGRIGRLVARKAGAFGLNVIAHTRSGDDQGTAARMVSLADLLAESDFLSFHAPLTPETACVINASALQRMKPTAFLINTSRGGLIDHDALWDAIRHGRLAGAALDVFDPEPPDLAQPLYRHERVIVTPHAAFVSEESVVELRSRVAHQIADCLSGRTPENVINPHIWNS